MIEITEQAALGITLYDRDIEIWKGLISKMAKSTKKAGYTKGVNISVSEEEVQLIKEMNNGEE